MNRNRSKAKIDRTMPMVHPNAAAIDIGATSRDAYCRLSSEILGPPMN